MKSATTVRFRHVKSLRIIAGKSEKIMVSYIHSGILKNGFLIYTSLWDKGQKLNVFVRRI